MDRYKDIITIGMNKGEWDFSIRATICELTYEEMNKLRTMITVAIGTSENMWRNRSTLLHSSVNTETKKELI